MKTYKEAVTFYAFKHAHQYLGGGSGLLDLDVVSMLAVIYCDHDELDEHPEESQDVFNTVLDEVMVVVNLLITDFRDEFMKGQLRWDTHQSYPDFCEKIAGIGWE